MRLQVPSRKRRVVEKIAPSLKTSHTYTLLLYTALFWVSDSCSDYPLSSWLIRTSQSEPVTARTIKIKTKILIRGSISIASVWDSSVLKPPEWVSNPTVNPSIQHFPSLIFFVLFEPFSPSDDLCTTCTFLHV